MKIKGLSSEQCFDRFSEQTQKITKAQFINAITKDPKLRFTASELEVVFHHLDSNKNGRITLEEWQNKIFEDSDNPLALLREVIRENQLTSDELLHKMQLRIWDDAMDLPKFHSCMRRLDPTLTDAQLKSLANNMKNA